MSVKVIDKGWNNFVKGYQQSEGATVTVGHHSDSGKTKDGEIGLAELMATLNFGSKKNNLPARDVYGTTFTDNKRKITKTIVMIQAMMASGKIPVQIGLNRMGAYYEGLLKKQFTKRKFAKLSPNYKKRPSGAKVTEASIPMVDTAILRNAIAYKTFRSRRITGMTVKASGESSARSGETRRGG